MYFNYKNINMYYEKHGNADEILIILPGWGNTRKSFDYLIQILKDYYTIYIVDYPGFGNTEFPNSDLNIYDYSNLIHEWIKSLNIENFTLLGHSFGGRIIITLTGYYGYNYKKIILMNAAGIKPKKTIKQKLRTLTYKTLKKIANILPGKYKAIFKEKLFKHFSSPDYRVLPDNMKKSFQNIIYLDLKPYLKNIKTKTLILWGNKDTSTPINDAFTMKKEIKNSKLYIFSNAGHFVYLDKFQEVLEILVKFIEEE